MQTKQGITQTKSNLDSNLLYDSVAYYVESFLLKQKAQRHTDQTLIYYRQKLGRFVWFLNNENYPSRLQDVTPNHIRQFFIYLQEAEARWGSNHPATQKPLSAWAIHGFARAVRAFWKWASREADMPNPFDKVDMPSLPNQWRVETFTEEEITTLLNACTRFGNAFNCQRNRTILALLLDSGMRASELLGLDIDSIDPHEGLGVVTGKGDKIRTIFIGQFARRELWVYLRDFRANLGDADNALFVARNGHALTYRGLHLVFKRLRELSGINRVDVRAHICRHTAATSMHRNGMRGANLQEILGHSEFSTTRKFYLDVNTETLKVEHERYGPLDHMTDQIAHNKIIEPKRVLSSNGRFVTALPDPHVLAEEVSQSSYRAVGRKYGVSDTAIRKRLKQAGLIR